MEGARPALPVDFPVCARLLAEARDQARSLRGGPELLAACPLRAPAPGADSARLDEHWLAEHWTGADRVLLVGTIDGVVVGVGAGRVTTRGDGRVGVVDCCYVEAEARGVGVGTALAEYLVRWFTDAGCVALDAPALPGDRATKQLFESQGLSARVLVLHRRLP